MFQTLVFHEIRPEAELYDQVRPIKVADGYQDALPLPLFNSTSHFKQQIDFFKAENYHTLTLAEVKDFYFRQQPLPEKSVLLTFDDCYQSMKEYAYPLLKEAGFKATAFVVTGWLFDAPQPYEPEVSRTLSNAELAEMSDVFEYANHTDHFHERKDQHGRSMWKHRPPLRKTYEAAISMWPSRMFFAYPFGFYDQQTIATLEKEGFVLAFTTKPGINTAQTKPMELHRAVIPFSLPMAAFEQRFRNEEMNQ
ncbi:polysaccharide deacetylase family protein [Enterococcus casseliflavus]|nr:polysaccharide deacetylase family protein [Enterococcus casseliflavus]